MEEIHKNQTGLIEKGKLEKFVKKDTRLMLRQLFYQKMISKTAAWVEIFIAGLVLVAIAYFTIVLIGELGGMMTGGASIEVFSEFLGSAFQIVIGVEFIKMLCKHTPATVVEVLMFAIARQMVVEHSTPLENLICIAGITILFAIRRFLFTESDKEDHYHVNFMEDVSEDTEEH